ncbi:hypothetical protein TanjilG_24351 [Lupinus angustifolius]|uniref:Uncharacterized protein n=1 Tax=Lupinus angustifolius TaxID=3871 RepID=A0A1J7I9Z8_LUPAN|nr:hypothetical protein TanjilG_24351 [Lupinus angustifolius]
MTEVLSEEHILKIKEVYDLFDKDGCIVVEELATMLSDFSRVKEVHDNATCCGMTFDVFLGNTFVHAYAKCKCFDGARVLIAFFTNNEYEKGVALFSQMEKAMETLRKLQNMGFKPNQITISSNLPACSILESLRMGKERMPMEPTARAWVRFFVLAEFIRMWNWQTFQPSNYLRLSPTTLGNYVSLFNILVTAKLWSEASETGILMKERNNSKSPCLLAICKNLSIDSRTDTLNVVHALEGHISVADLTEGIRPGYNTVFSSYGSSTMRPHNIRSTWNLRVMVPLVSASPLNHKANGNEYDEE